MSVQSLNIPDWKIKFWYIHFMCIIAQRTANACSKSNLLFVNHFKDNPKKTAESERGDFFVTGDRGIMDEDGYFQFIGRDDDIIISSGSVCMLPL